MKYFKGGNEDKVSMDLTTPTLARLKPDKEVESTERNYSFSYWVPEEYQVRWLARAVLCYAVMCCNALCGWVSLLELEGTDYSTAIALAFSGYEWLAVGNMPIVFGCGSASIPEGKGRSCSCPG
jgi:hypothetical protein